MGSALLEHALKDAITVHLSDDNATRSRATKELFEYYDRSPLAYFGAARIMAAYALGIIDQTTRKNLDIVRDIRNNLAHSIVAIERPGYGGRKARAFARP